MSLKVVEYNDRQLDFVNQYMNLPKEERVGNYWNNKSNEDSLAKIKKHIKGHYIEVQDYTCVYCKQRVEIKHNAVWDAEHIIPKDKYPDFMFEPENLCISCKDCNQEKLNKNVLTNEDRKTFPKESKDYKIIHPHFDTYHKHIKILKSSLFFVPMDKKGRATIETCGLLRFLYKFTDYGNISLELKKKLGSLQMELLSTNDPIIENVILGAMGDLVEHGKEISKQKALKKIIS